MNAIGERKEEKKKGIKKNPNLKTVKISQAIVTFPVFLGNKFFDTLWSYSFMRGLFSQVYSHLAMLAADDRHTVACLSENKAARSSFWSRFTQQFVCTFLDIHHLLTLQQEMVSSDPMLISDEEMLNNTSAKTPSKAEQRQSLVRNMPQEKLAERTQPEKGRQIRSSYLNLEIPQCIWVVFTKCFPITE